MPGPLDHLLFLVLAVLGPVWGATFGYRRLARAAPGRLPEVRVSVYRWAMVLQWSLVLALALGWALAGRPWGTLGLAPAPTWGLAGVLVGSAITVVFVWIQRRAAIRDDEALETVRERMRHVAPMLPQTPFEMRQFAALSVTAGVCEELLYRGFMIQYLAHFVGLVGAAAIASFLFGVGHAYQGPRGMLLTGIVGGFLAAVYLISGSLYAPMLLHALMDLHSGHLAYVANRRGEEQRLEEQRRAEEEEGDGRALLEDMPYGSAAQRYDASDEALRHALAAEPRSESDRGGDGQEVWDVAVVGLGAIGSAALAHLQRAGLRAVGIDRFAVPNAHGSTHGESRIIREAYFEHPDYVPLVQRAYEGWRALERDTGETLMRETGGVMIGPESGVLVRGALASAHAHELPYELLDASELRRRLPAFAPVSEWVGVWEPRAGVLAPEACVEAHLSVARRAGARIREHERLIAWDASDGQIEIATDHGVVRARHLVLAAGPWMSEALGDLPLPLSVERVVQAWFEPRDASALGPDRCPIHLWEYEPDRFVYGFPQQGGLVKAALHHDGAIVDPETVAREVTTADLARIAEPLARCIPAAVGPVRRAAVCLYTNTPDGHFVLDRHPAFANVIVASCCSGHGFKFAPAIGETIARMVQDPGERSSELFHIDRWS